ncbi:hypothetical protein V6N11_047418 [Hibiscus sabdariffa]|uniref:Uncharacterized protein n=1 Tax=Hibiscus sabdariffa TaxID=183260 RepID=A0ABR2A4H6_9ROSI
MESPTEHKLVPNLLGGRGRGRGPLFCESFDICLVRLWALNLLIGSGAIILSGYRLNSPFFTICSFFWVILELLLVGSENCA